MLKYMLLLLLLPSVATAQSTLPVMPVESKDYLDLINKDSSAGKDAELSGTDNSFKKATLSLKGRFYNLGFQKIEVKDSYVRVHPHKESWLAIGATLNSGVEIKKANSPSALQNQYVQGRANGQIQWRGPETNELFSYGPAVASLEFDGSNYQYDIHGRLVPQGSGNGLKAIAYKNNILRSAFLFSQSLNIQANHTNNGLSNWNASLRVGYSNDNTILKGNKNIAKNLAASMQVVLKPFIITGNYAWVQDRFSNSNRNGFLNRVYQNALLTPVSFDNSQGTKVGTAQRSYSLYADNPYFLLEDNLNAWLQSHYLGGLTVQGNQKGKLRYKLIQSFDLSSENSQEADITGSAFYPNGIYTTRDKKDIVYFLKASPTLKVDYGTYSKFESEASFNYIFTHAKSGIHYSLQGPQYGYTRSSHDFSLNYNAIYSGDLIRIGAEAGNKLYLSSTSTKNRFFLPAVAGFVFLKDVLDKLDIKLSSALTHSDNEVLLDRSISHANLLRVSTADVRSYFPLLEAKSFDHLKPIHHREWSGRIEFDITYKIKLSGEVFIKKTFDDVYPVFENDELVLRNMADHRKTGVEIQLNLHEDLFRSKAPYSSRLRFSNAISFLAWQNKVTAVRDGYDYTPLAGFSNIHKAIVRGQPFGAILGSSFQTDAAGNMIIGLDGFPLADNQLRIIGNPIPDFTVKLNNTLTWKRFRMNVDWEWRKGGEAWNGTQAMLDYYGRSQQTAELRNTTNYIFPGVLQNGHPNTIPVSFYDPSVPFEKNRWVRYGPGGVAKDYIQKTDMIRLQTVALAYKIIFKKHIESVTLTSYINNLVLWSAYKGADPGTRLLFDQPNAAGLDFFNLPATKTYGLSASIQF